MASRSLLCLIIISALHFSYGDPYCPSFQCKAANQTFYRNQCAYREKIDGYSVQGCKGKTKYCKFNKNKDLSYCESELKHPGQKCSFSSECNTYACDGGWCVGTNSKCRDSYECNPGHFCSQGNCERLKIMGSSCENDAECNYGTLCMDKIARCVPIGSLEVGTEISECTYGINLLCQYGTCAFLEHRYVCNKPVKSKSEFSEGCSIDSNCQRYGCCLSEYDDLQEKFISKRCFCRRHETERGICPLFQGDEPMQLAIQQVMNWHNSTEIRNCNSSRRDDLICAKEMLDENAYQKLINSLVYVKFYPVNLNFDECVLNALTTNLLGKMSDYLVPLFDD